MIQNDVVIRGDLVRQQQSSASKPTLDPSSSKQAAPAQTVSIHLGRYVFISPGCTLHPPSRLSSSSNPSIPASTQATHPNYALTSTSTDLAARRASAMAPPISPHTLSPEEPPTYNGPLPEPSSVAHPGQTLNMQTLTYYPLRISSHVYLGPSTYCNAASIGSHVYIGARCVIGNMVIIKDNVRVEDDTVLPAGSVWRSGIVIKGRPGRVVGSVGEGWATGAAGEGAGGGISGGGGGGGGFEGWGRELWASVGNHVKKV